MGVEGRVASRMGSATPPLLLQGRESTCRMGPTIRFSCLSFKAAPPLPYSLWQLESAGQELVQGQQSYTSEHTATTQQAASACSNTSNTALTLRVGSDLTNASWRDSRGLQSTEGQSLYSWLEYRQVFAYAGKREGFVVPDVDVCGCAPYKEDSVVWFPSLTIHALAALALSIASVFHPLCLTHTNRAPASWCMWTHSVSHGEKPSGSDFEQGFFSTAEHQIGSEWGQKTSKSWQCWKAGGTGCCY